MRREFVLNIIFLIAANLIVKPGYTFIIETQVQNIVGPEEFGLYFSLFNLSYIFQIVLDLGIHNYGSQYLAKNSDDSEEYLSTAFTAKAWLILFFAFTIAAIGFLLNYNPRMRFLLLLVAVNQIFISAIFFYRSSLAALGHYRMNSLISVLDKIMMISIFIFALFIDSEWRARFSIYDFIYIRMASYFVTAVISALLLYLVARQVTRWVSSFYKIRAVVKRSLPFAIIVVFMGICNRTDAVMLERLLQDNGLQSGIYAAAYRIYHALNTIGFLFSMLLLPMFANLLISNHKELNKLTLLSLNTIVFLTVGAVSIIYLWKEKIMDILYQSDATLYGSDILVLLCLTLVLSSIIYILGTLLTANAKLKKLNILFIVAAIFNIGLNWVLIPNSGAYGAAWATLLTELLVVLGQCFLVYWITPFRASFGQMVRLIGFIIIVCTGSYFMQHLSLDTIIKTFVMSGFIMTTAIGTSVFRPHQFIQLLKSNSGVRH